MIDQKDKNQIAKIFKSVLRLEKKMIDGISQEMYFPTAKTPKKHKEENGSYRKSYNEHSSEETGISFPMQK